MEYHPKYPQPFTLSQAIALDPAVAWDEISRLRNSLQHLKRTQTELQEYLLELTSTEEDLEVLRAVKENEITIASQDERIFMLKLALTHHGHSVTSEHISEQTISPSVSHESRVERSTMGSSSNGLDDADAPVNRTRAAIPHGQEVEEPENGLYL